MKARHRVAMAGVAALMAVCVGVARPTVTPAGAAPLASLLGVPLGATSGGPAALVNPIDGTGVGSENPGNVSEFPGATVPLGMVQFSPDTSPDRQLTTGSGYDNADSEISGFSLTHLSGDGCAIYGDIPILPVTGALPADPENALQPFSHADERATAGNYSVGLGAGSPSERIGVNLTATARTALGAFAFPAGTGDALLFKVSDSADGSSASTVRVVGNTAVEGSVTSGNFCGIPGNYTLYFTAQFSEKFGSSGTWQDGPAGTNSSCVGTSSRTCGAWVSFDQADPTSQRVLVKVGVSFVSPAGATANLQAENPGWDFQKTSGEATAQWNGLLGRMAVTGGSTAHRRTFYTALYHSLLFPSIFSDDDGRYMGFDHKVHALPKGQVQFSNISECDEYKTEVPLLAMLLPGPTSQMVQSLLRDAAQTKGHFLPKWVIGNNDAGEWDGDSADPIIADAYAYGARRFNLDEAVKLMIHGATVAGRGFIVERQNVQEYQAQGWVPQLTYDITSYPYTVGGSETLEYAVDDFSISRLARAAGETHAATTFAHRGQNWQNLFNPSTGYLAARTADGSFPPGPAFQPASPAEQQQGIAQEGFEEGNAIQYTWSESQDLAGLIGLMGGNEAAVAKLNAFFTQLNATRFGPEDWAGNEPAMSAPYDYDYAGDPAGTQSVVRRIMNQLYAAAPVNEPGEDDLGALSSWYVWSALGLYPETPGVANLALTSPLFPKVTVAEGNGHSFAVVGTHAPDTYIRRVALAIGSDRSRDWEKPWVPMTALAHGAALSVTLGRRASPTWATSPSEAPPSFQAGAAPAVPFTTPGGELTMPANSSTTFQLGVQEAERSGSGASVTWHLVAPTGTAGVTISADSGGLTPQNGRATTTLRITSRNPGRFSVAFDLRQGGRSLPNLTLDVTVASP